jgi:hypothetical protein
VEIAVGPTLLGLISSLSANKDPEAAEIFKRLEGVRIKVYKTAEVKIAGPDARPETAMQPGGIDQVNKISSSLSAGGWESVVKVNEPEEQVRIFMKMNGEMVEGITVMAMDESEAAFINVIGNLNPAELQKVMDNFDVEIGDDDDKEGD